MQSFTTCNYIVPHPPPQQSVASFISFADTCVPVAADNAPPCNLVPRVLLHDSESVQQRQFYTPPAPPPGCCRHLSQSLPSAGGQALAICSAVWSSPWSIGWSSDVEFRWWV